MRVTLLERYARRLKGQTAWILGGRRIGQTVARSLAEQGVHLIINYHFSRAEAEKTAAQARRLGVKAVTVRADASSPASLATAMKSFQKTFPRIDILINMTSVFDEITLEKITPL